MAPGAPGTADRRSLRHWTRGADVLPVAVLVVLPALLLVVPALLGHPAITGDNLIQNFPLRVLTGVQLRQGHLPLWNPYVWGGSPLLGGLNAGSFYPFSFLFAVLAPVGAWVANLLAVYWAGGLGLYALARQYRLRPLAALLGALTYTLSGTMVGQIVHLGVVQGMGLAPFLVLAEIRLSWAVLGTGPAKAGRGSRRWRRSPWPWVALLALVVGLEALTGEPRSMAETEVLGSAVGAWLLLRPYAGGVPARRRIQLLGCSLLGGAWGVALAAAELAPGWAFIRASQRAVESYQFFGSGSLRVPWTFLLVVPDLVGGSGHFGQPIYFDRYNLAEVTGYVGLLPLGAALVLASRSFGRRRSTMASDWGLWLALLVFGLLLAWGSYTPLGHLWAAIPLFGKTRLQSRNLGIVDLTLAMLLAFWVDRLASRQAAEGTAGWRRLLAVAPALVAVGTCVVTLAAPVAVEGWFDVTPSGASLARTLWPWFLAETLVAAGVVALVFGWRRLAPGRRRTLLAAVVVCDLTFFLLAVSTVTEPPAVTLEPSHATAAAVLGSDGRFAIADTEVSHVNTLSAVGQPDLNAFTELPSVQGYGSIVSSQYAAATDTHTLDTLSGCDLATGVFGQLRLSTLLAFPGDLAPGLRAGEAPAPPPPCPGAPRPGTAHLRLLYLGWTATLASATLTSVARVPARSPLRVGVLGPDGGTRWPNETVRRTAHGWSVRFSRTTKAAGLVIEGPARDVSDTSTVRGPKGNGWAFDGILQDALGTTGWRFTGTLDHTFGRFARTTVLPPVWLARPAPGSSVRQLGTSDWGTAVDRVVATRPATVVWSEAYLPGWHAELSPMDGSGRGRRQAVRLDVTEHGLVQAVRVPPGTWTLTFVYRAPHLTLGIAGSLVGVAGFAALGAVTLVDVRRRRAGTHRASLGGSGGAEGGEGGDGRNGEAGGAATDDGLARWAGDGPGNGPRRLPLGTPADNPRRDGDTGPPVPDPIA